MPLGPTGGGVRPVVLALDGRSGAGKTALAGRLSVELAARGRTCTVVHLDDLYPGWSGLASALPTLCAEVLGPLRLGAPAGYRSWDWQAAAPGPRRAVRPAALVVVEGVGAGALPCADLVDLVVWLEVEVAVRRRRAMERDGAALAEHWDDWAAQEDRVFARRGGQGLADVVLEHVDARSLGALADRAEDLLAATGS